MINELYSLSRVLERERITLTAAHRTRRSLSGKNNLRVWLDDKGEVCDVELLSPELAGTLSKFGDNQSTLPAFNIAPLFRVSSDEEKKLVKAISSGKSEANVEALRRICAFDNWGQKRIKQVNACLKRKFPDMSGCEIVKDLLNICENLSAEALRASLERFVFRRLGEKRDIAMCLSLLIHEGSSNKDDKPEGDSGSLSIFLDICSWEDYGRPVANADTIEQINRILIKADIMADSDADAQNSVSGKDAFGENYTESAKPMPMPSVRIDAGFEVVLRSMFHEQRCQFRYSKADDNSYPLTQNNRMSMQAALQWIATAKHRKVMWDKIGKDAALFIYPDRLPPSVLRYSSVFARSSAQAQKKFEDAAKSFIQTLEGIPVDERPQNLQVFTMRQIPPSLSKRAKIDLTHNLSADDLAACASDWANGFANIPPCDEKEAVTLFPLEVYSFVNQVWKRDGETKKEVPQMRYYEGMGLLLGLYSRSIILHHLRGLLANVEGLVCFLGNVRERFKLKELHRDAFNKLMPLLGLFLYKLGCNKEDYMENPAFLLGQVIKVSDELHALYCKHVRKGDIPAQFAGNAVFIGAGENPAKSLSLLGDRMMPYISWANRYLKQEKDDSSNQENADSSNQENDDSSNQKKDDRGLVGWYFNLYAHFFGKLNSHINNDLRFDDVCKAQLFMGYLAKFPSSEELKNEELKNTDSAAKPAINSAAETASIGA